MADEDLDGLAQASRGGIGPPVAGSSIGREDHQARRVGSSGVMLIRMRQADFETVQPAGPDFTLSILLAGRSRPWRDLGDGLTVPRGAEGFRHHGGGILTPHGTAVSWRVEGTHDCLILAFPFREADRALEELLPDGAKALYRLTGGVISDPVLPALSRQLWEQEEGRIGTLFADHALALVLAQLARHADSAGQMLPAPRPREHLAPRAQKRAEEFLEANLAGDPSLEEAAAAVGLSPYHFLRAFKAATGRTPFRWLQDRRIQRAADLLASTDASLAEIALEVGFKNQSHFTVVFRRAMGRTPSRWREDARS